VKVLQIDSNLLSLICWLQIDESWNGFAYICDGSGTVGGSKGKREQNLVLGKGDHVIASTTDPAGLRFLLVAGKPIGEPIVQHGPFVMNTQGAAPSLFLISYRWLISGRFHASQLGSVRVRGESGTRSRGVA
jgi:hypothetical protein